MAISDEIREQTKKFKTMNASEKADYIYTYYKWWILGALAVIFIIINVAKSVMSNSIPTYLNAMFINSTVGAFDDANTLEQEYVDKYTIDVNENTVDFDFTVYLDQNYGNQQSMAYQSKIISMYSAEQLDIVCGPESILTSSADVGGYANLSEVLPQGMLDNIINKGYEPFYYVEKIYADDAEMDADGNMPYTEGEKYIGGIYIDNCKKLVGKDSTCPYIEVPDGDRLIMTIAWNTQNLEHAIEFIDFVTQ